MPPEKLKDNPWIEKKIFTNHKSHKGLESVIYKKFIQLNIKHKNNPFKNEQEI